MSAARNQGGSWFNANYEKVALLAALALLLVSVALLFLILNGKRSAVTAASWDRVPSSPAAAGGVNTALVAGIQSGLANPLQIPPERRQMAVGPLRVACVARHEPIDYNATNCPFCGAVQPTNSVEDIDSDGDGMKDVWEKKHNLNPLDPTDALADPDADGYTNLDEYTGQTDAHDAKSIPDPVTKLRHKKIKAESFKFRFLGISKLPSGNRYQLNLRDLSRTYFTTNGQTIEGVTVTGCDESNAKKPVLILQQGARTRRLPLNEVIIEDSYSCELVSLIDRKPFPVTRGATFKLGDAEYNVVDITSSAVVIRSAKNGRESTVLPLTDDELRGGGVGGPETMRRPGTEGAVDPFGSLFEFPTR